MKNKWLNKYVQYIQDTFLIIIWMSLFVALPVRICEKYFGIIWFIVYLVIFFFVILPVSLVGAGRFMDRQVRKEHERENSNK